MLKPELNRKQSVQGYDVCILRIDCLTRRILPLPIFMRPGHKQNKGYEMNSLQILSFVGFTLR